MSGVAAVRQGADPEVSDKPLRRTYTAEYKQAIVRQAAACAQVGEIGRLLRREGLYSSHLGKWRAQFEDGGDAALLPHKRGPKRVEVHPAERRVSELERENRVLQERLRQAELIIEVQKKVAQMLDSFPASTPQESKRS
jgi:transposase-like protein